MQEKKNEKSVFAQFHIIQMMKKKKKKWEKALQFLTRCIMRRRKKDVKMSGKTVRRLLTHRLIS